MLLNRDLDTQCLPFAVVQLRGAQPRGFPGWAKLGTARTGTVPERVGHLSVQKPLLL